MYARHSEYELVNPLEKEFRLIIPAMDGFYDNCPIALK